MSIKRPLQSIGFFFAKPIAVYGMLSSTSFRHELILVPSVYLLGSPSCCLTTSCYSKHCIYSADILPKLGSRHPLPQKFPFRFCHARLPQPGRTQITMLCSIGAEGLSTREPESAERTVWHGRLGVVFGASRKGLLGPGRNMASCNKPHAQTPSRWVKGTQPIFRAGKLQLVSDPHGINQAE